MQTKKKETDAKLSETEIQKKRDGKKKGNASETSEIANLVP